jgi:hypothetical protein
MEKLIWDELLFDKIGNTSPTSEDLIELYPEFVFVLSQDETYQKMLIAE